MINHYFQDNKNEKEEEKYDENINIKNISIEKKNEERFHVGEKDEINFINSVRQPSIEKIIKEYAQSDLNQQMTQKFRITSRKAKLMNKKK